MTEKRTTRGYTVELERTSRALIVTAVDPLHHISVSIEGAWNAASDQLEMTAIGHLDFMRARLAAAEA